MKATASKFRIPPLIAAVAAALIQTAVLGYMVESRASILRSGAEVRLKTAPVDPRDLLRGDYVTLGYQISSIPGSIVTGDVPTAPGRQSLWVRLVPATDGLWSASRASFAPMPHEPGSVVARSLPFSYYPGADGQVPETLFVSYGIERYYVPEGEGRVLEEVRNAQALVIAARVAADGTMQIRQILVNNQPAYEEPLY